MAKTCQHEGCNNPVFSNGYCSWHQSDRTDKKYLKSLLKKYQKGNAKIKPKSEKRTQEDIIYKQVKKLKEVQLKKKGEWRCIFCNMPFSDYETPGWHHLSGRDGDLITDPKYLFPAHSNCHLRDYHQATVQHMKSMFWYEGFLERIENIDIDLYNKEMRKASKS